MSRRKTTTKKLPEAAQQLVDKLRITEERVYKVVKSVIDDCDPDSLLKLGCPEDEYNPVSKRIAEQVLAEGCKKLSVTELAHLIAFALHYSFGRWSRPIDLHLIHFEMAKKLADKLAKL